MRERNKIGRETGEVGRTKKGNTAVLFNTECQESSREHGVVVAHLLSMRCPLFLVRGIDKMLDT